MNEVAAKAVVKEIGEDNAMVALVDVSNEEQVWCGVAWLGLVWRVYLHLCPCLRLCLCLCLRLV